MSFSQIVKEELCHLRPAGCCKYAECYGMLLFGRSFSQDNISFLTADKGVCFHLSELLKSCFDANIVISEGGIKKPTYLLVVDNPFDVKRILIKFGRYGSNSVLGINNKMFDKECCTEAFIRGAFLACGSIIDPEKAFHVEFAVKKGELCQPLFDVMTEKGLVPKMTLRQGKNVIYFKKAADIEDLLTVIGATMHTLELMNIQIYKDMRNRTNRIKNCDNGNISKTVAASMAQCDAIKKLEKCGRLETLPEELYEAAMLRKENPEESLSQLCKIANNKITRSGLNHRIKKIIELANELK